MILQLIATFVTLCGLSASSFYLGASWGEFKTVKRMREARARGRRTY